MDAERNNIYTVGELAKMSGISVRTLQYYDRYGLLVCRHSDGGRRLYGRGDLIRLQQILFLKSYGFSLAQIRDRLIEVNTGPQLAELLTAQKEAIACQIACLRDMAENLDRIIEDVRDCDTVSTDTFVAMVELSRLGEPGAFVGRYFSGEQLDRLIGTANAKQQQDMSKKMFGELLRLYQSGVDPRGEEGQQLAAHFWKMATELSYADPKMLRAFVSMGIDAKNWPEEAKELRSAVSDFMSTATAAYLESQGIALDQFSDLLKP